MYKRNYQISVCFLLIPLQINCTWVLSVPERISREGYQLQTFSNVVTEDEYVLTVFRIICGNPCINRENKPAVLLMHGLFGSSREFILLGPTRGLGYLLADKGYDVWLANARGTEYSQNHKRFNVDADAKKYWDFSWHEIGYYDLPAIINTIKATTKQNKIMYIGVSMGTTVFFVLTSTRPQYNKDVSLMIALAPSAFQSNVFNPFINAFSKLYGLLHILPILNVHEFPPKNLTKPLGYLGRSLCRNRSIVQFCSVAYFLTGGYNPKQLNTSSLNAIAENGPSSASLGLLIHYAQNINSGNFEQYDYGPIKNMMIYKDIKPARYNLNQITTPVYIFYSKGDWLINPKDVNRLCRELVNCVLMYQVKDDYFGHLDFLFAIDVVELVYKHVFEPFKLYKLETGPSTSGEISPEVCLEYYKQMFTIRVMENMTMTLYRSKKISGFCHLYMGQEAIAVGIFNLLRPQDSIVTSYRVHGWAYLLAKSVKPVIAELFGNKKGISKGKGGSMHMYNTQLYGGAGIVGAQVPVGTGLSLAQMYKNNGGITIIGYGDGAANQGQIFESYNIAKLWNLPSVFLCENNKYSMGTSLKRGSAAEDSYTRAGYIPGLWMDGNDIFSVLEATKFIIGYCTSGKGPLVVEASTYRFTGHSMSDPDTSYRTRDEIQGERSRNDPVKLFREAIISLSVATDENLKTLEDSLKKQVDSDIKAVMDEEDLPAEELAYDIYTKNVETSIRGVNPWIRWQTGVTDPASLP
ncbi:hypothetical protein FQA39_LY15612 [Lamprigera yunnana]|nr:hypothetical protein FQA39_LY15612 [Lamprigera yunnana]